MVVRHLPAWLRLKACSMSFRSHWERRVRELDAEGVAENLDGVGVGVQRPAHGGDQVLVGGPALQGLFDDALTGAGHAQDQAQSPLLAVDLERVVNRLLVRQQFDLAALERVAGESEVRANHGCSFRRASPLATTSSRRAAPMRWPRW
jgi:hypothetical protein